MKPMNIIENIRNALGAIGSNKMRSMLTMLGIIIGVASVVLMVAIGQGAQRGVTQRIQSLGTNLLTISPGGSNQGNVRFGGGGGGGGATLKSTDATAIEQQVTGLSGVEPEMRSNEQIIAGSQNTNASVIGTVPDYVTVRNSPLQIGRFINQQDIASMDRVAVLGSQVVTTLFPSDPAPIGQSIRIGSNLFTVIGVMQSKGGTGFQNQDNVVLIPLSTMQQHVTGQSTLSSISVSVANAADMSTAQATITAVLMNAHRITDVTKEDFTVLNQADAVQTLDQVTGIFTLLLGGIAAISLFVGGIGVMNIMLVSVTERTREIGIRKAIGAKKRDILLQFLVESTALSILGGAIGILISFIGSFILGRYSIDATISIPSVILAFLFSVGVGIFFGMLPAWKAAKLRPIEALRYE
ncbi:MAG TPA: ABC transporter permease [Candidatus Peribacteraceae bacterium]|nr:ABC transporter permease [Candidatus Peribacteraceae bacterium]